VGQRGGAVHGACGTLRRRALSRPRHAPVVGFLAVAALAARPRPRDRDSRPLRCALRILREEDLPIYDRLGNFRQITVAFDMIAEVLRDGSMRLLQ
jgi:hypothetical protein